MAYENICISCFRDMGGKDTCPHCGNMESGNRKSYYLPARAILQDRYLIGECIATDRNTISYKALDMDEKRIVEIQEHFPRDAVARSKQSMDVNVISPEFTANFEKSVRTISENARTMMQFADSPNIIHIYNAFTANNTVYIVNEYLEGLTLEDYLKENGGALSPEAATDIIIAVLDGLQRIHKENLVHRAVIPRNIVLTTGNQIKLINFTFLKEITPYKESEMTVYFFPGYAPYEQYVSREIRGAHTDIYSAGAVLYRMLMGRKPQDAIDRKTGDTLRNSFEPSIPETIVLSICKAMNMDKELRFKSAADFRNALLGKSEVVDVISEIEDEKNKKEKRSVIILSAVLAVLVVILAVVAFNFLHT